MPTATVLSHRGVAHELGHLEPWLEHNGFTVDRRYREDGLALPAADLLIVMGSPESVAQGHVGPRAQQEIQAVAQWLTQGRPYLGICFGAQVLATATGGRVQRMPAPFHAYTRLEGFGVAADPLVGPWTVWHNDGIEAAASDQVLASLDHARLVVRVGRAWGVQPHIEATPETLRRMGTDLGAPADVYEPIVAALRADEVDNALRAAALLDAFLVDVNRTVTP